MNMEGRRYDFRGWGKLECEAHRGGPLAVSLLDGLVSKKKLLYGRTAEKQKVKTFRLAEFYAQKLSGQSA